MLHAEPLSVKEQSAVLLLFYSPDLIIRIHNCMWKPKICITENELHFGVAGILMRQLNLRNMKRFIYFCLYTCLDWTLSNLVSDVTLLLFLRNFPFNTHPFCDAGHLVWKLRNFSSCSWRLSCASVRVVFGAGRVVCVFSPRAMHTGRLCAYVF